MFDQHGKGHLLPTQIRNDPWIFEQLANKEGEKTDRTLHELLGYCGTYQQEDRVKSQVSSSSQK
jgi:hypothetical protein